MSTSLLYHGFCIRGYQHVRTDFVDGEIHFTIRQDPGTLRCPQCGSRHVHPKGRVVRKFRCLPIGSKPVKVILPIPRVACGTGKVPGTFSGTTLFPPSRQLLPPSSFGSVAFRSARGDDGISR